jgi:CRISPR-associated protein Cas1
MMHTDSEPVTIAGSVEVDMATLYLMEQYSMVRVEEEALRVQFPKDRETNQRGRVVRVPLAKIEQVMVMGDITLTTPALHTLLEMGIPVHYLSLYGKSYGTLTANPGKNSGLRMAQCALRADPVRQFAVARQCVAGKLVNMRTLLLRYARSREDGDHTTLEAAAEQVRRCLQQLKHLETPVVRDPADRMNGLGPLLGLEGSGSRAYYGALEAMLRGEEWQFAGRVKRPPTDPINALLSFGYTILTKQVVSLVWAVGLDPGIGVLHQPGFGKPALALDLVEQFRPLVVDSVVLTLLNTGQLKPNDFRTELGGCWLKDDARKLFLNKLESRLDEKVQHPLFNYKVTYRRCIELQARLFAKYAMGEIERYAPFTVR